MDELSLAEALSDISTAPDGVTMSVAPGWPSPGTDDEPAPESAGVVVVGSREWPARFHVTVASTDASTRLKGVLLFALPTDVKRVTYEGGWALEGEWDIFERWVFSLRNKQWWKRVTFVSAANHLWALTIASRFGTDFSETSNEDFKRIRDEMESQLRDGLEVPTTRRRDRITDDVLREVAGVYRDAWASGKNPTKAVEQHFYKSPATASRWVSLARRAGHLRPSDSTRGGEVGGADE